MTKALCGFALALAAAIVSAGQAAAQQPTKKLYVDVNDQHAQLAGSCSSPQVPCRRITDALARAREIRYEQMLEPGYSDETVRPIEIIIAEGNYVGTFGDNPDGTLEEYPLLINVPRVALRGATRLGLDELGRPEVKFQPDGTTLKAVDDRVNTVLRIKAGEVRLQDQYVILAVPTIQSATGRQTSGAGATIEGLSFDVGGTGTGSVLAADRAPGFTVRGCAFASVGPVETANSQVLIEANLFYKGAVSAALVRAGDGATSTVRDNTAVGKASGSLYLSAVGYDAVEGTRVNNQTAGIYKLGRHASEFQYEPFAMPPHVASEVSVENNLFTGSNNTASLLGFGVRIVGTDGQVAARGATGELDVTLRRNELTNNRDGLDLDAGWPFRAFGGKWTTTIRLYLEDNTISGNSRSTAAMSFTRIQTAFAPTNTNSPLTAYKYGEDSTFEITDPAGSVANMWVDHLVQDPLSGTPLNNTFIYNGNVVAPPKRSCGYPTLTAPYAPTAPCAP